jgi:hypothetical protein
VATFLSDFLSQLDERWSEVNLLLAKAKELRDSDEPFYNAICRSVSFLLIAHLEGFIKDACKNVIKDLNQSATFNAMPTAVQRTYCRKYLGSNRVQEDQAYEKRIKLLVTKFSELNSDITFEPFLFSTNKNPNPNIIETILGNFGVPDVFACLHNSTFDEAFSDTQAQLYSRIEEFRAKLLNAVQEFPFKLSMDEYNFEYKKVTGVTPLWSEFVNQINQTRHSIAHGNDFKNGEDITTLETRKNMVVLLQLVLAATICSEVSRQSVKDLERAGV